MVSHNTLCLTDALLWVALSVGVCLLSSSYCSLHSCSIVRSRISHLNTLLYVLICVRGVFVWDGGAKGISLALDVPTFQFSMTVIMSITSPDY